MAREVHREEGLLNQTSLSVNAYHGTKSAKYLTHPAPSCIFINVKVNLKEVSAIKKEIEVTVPAEDVGLEFDSTYQKIGQKARLKGFRPGKIPRPVLEQYYREDAASEVVQNLIRKSYPAAVQEAGLMPIASPEIRVIAFGVSQDFAYNAAIEIRPAFEVKNYKGISLARDKIEVTEAEVEDNLKALQERMAQLVPVTEARTPRPSDVVSIDYQGFFGGAAIPQFKAADFLIELGKGYVFPELESGILKMLPGEKKKIQVTYPADWADKNLAGKKVDLEVLLKDLKEKRLPELNDDFAKDMGSFLTLEEVKAKICEDVTRSKEQSAKAALRRQVIESLIRSNDFPVPEGLIQSEIEEMLHRLEGSLKGQGMTLEQAGITREDFFAKSREEAVFRVKGALLFDEIAQKEGVAVSGEEVDRRIDDMARLAGQSGAAWKRTYQEKDLLSSVEAGIREEKTLDFILTQSKIGERKAGK